MLKKVINVINWIKSRPSNERMFKQKYEYEYVYGLCMNMDKDNIRLLPHTRVRLLSKGNCLERFISLDDTILAFVGDREEFEFLKSRKFKT